MKSSKVKLQYYLYRFILKKIPITREFTSGSGGEVVSLLVLPRLGVALIWRRTLAGAPAVLAFACSLFALHYPVKIKKTKTLTKGCDSW
jgi:hypothetical protein